MSETFAWVGRQYTTEKLRKPIRILNAFKCQTLNFGNKNVSRIKCRNLVMIQVSGIKVFDI